MRGGHAMAFDTIRDAVVIRWSAGFPAGAPGTLFGDTWEHAGHAAVNRTTVWWGPRILCHRSALRHEVKERRARHLETFAHTGRCYSHRSNAQLLFDPPVEDRYPGFSSIFHLNPKSPV
jgi:hypothetical protein